MSAINIQGQQPTGNDPLTTTTAKEFEKIPIIIVPGVMGSNLYNYMGGREWPPLIPQVNGSSVEIGGLPGALEISNQLYVNPIVNQVPLKKSYREYGAKSAYKQLVNRICEKFPDREVYFYSYDFRQDNRVIARELHGFIVNKGFQKVDFVCHSMGGIVLSHYCNITTNYVKNAITLGTPYDGSCNLLRALMTYQIMNQELISLAIWLLGLSSEIKLHLPGAVQLAPTTRYVDSVPQSERYQAGTETVRQRRTEIQRPTYGIREISTQKYIQLMDQIVKNNPTYAEVRAAQDEIAGMGALQSIPNSYYGIGVGEITIKSAILYDSPYTTSITFYDGYTTSQGDGTVPMRSATKLGELARLGSKRVRYFNGYEHEKLVGGGMEAVEWAVDILEKGESTRGLPSPPAEFAYTVLKTACPVDVTVSSGTNLLSSAPGNYIPDSDFGQLYLMGQEGDIKFFTLKDQLYDVSVQGTGTGTMDYELRFFDETNFLAETRTFEEVPITEQTQITSRIDRQAETELAVDADGKGRPQPLHPVVSKNQLLWPGAQAELVPLAEDARDIYRLIDAAEGKKTILFEDNTQLPLETLQALAEQAAEDRLDIAVHGVDVDWERDRPAVQILLDPRQSTQAVALSATITKAARSQRRSAKEEPVAEISYTIQTRQRQAYGQTVELVCRLEPEPQGDKLLEVCYRNGQHGSRNPLPQTDWRYIDGHLHIHTERAGTFVVNELHP